MPREPKKTGNRTPGETVPTQYRLEPETLADLDIVAAELPSLTGMAATRTNAIRHLARQGAKKILKKSSNSA